nr:uncharacterized protein LOC108056814 [Drosophila takahashii]
MVWDAAAEVNGVSLNHALLKGPDILVSLMGVLMRFREGKVAVAGDIREMFHQVKVRPEDQGSQMFLWRGGDTSRDPDIYAERFSKQSPEAVAAICRNTFVDDWLESADSESDMISLAGTQLTKIKKRFWDYGGCQVLTSSRFFIIRAKIILQNIWRSGVGWDDPLQDNDATEWRHWLDLLPRLKEVRIPRCIPRKSGCLQSQLHTFVDASLNAYAAVVFLRTEADGEVQCPLVASKTRVAPLKPVSVPRLELLAAVLGLRLSKSVEAEMTIHINQRIFCTSWGNNVADDGTKWTRDPSFDGSSRWFVGPGFLYRGEDQWPDMNPSTKNEEIIMHHEKSHTETPAIACIVPDPQRFSKLEKLRSTQSKVLQFLRLVIKEPKDGHLQQLLHLKRAVDSDVILVRVSQEMEFPEEIKTLRADESGVMRVKGRINAIEGVELDVKQPIILSRRHRVTYLIADYYHRRFHHLNDEIVVNEMKQRYWIKGLRALVREVAKDCPRCRIRNARPAPPEMGSLPQERLSPYTLPFTFTGVDYFGPIDVVVGRRREKRWGVLFTCLTTRAVHLEVAVSLSTDSFLCILKTFVARRGVPRRILSDNGTTFRGANGALQHHIERISTSAIEREYPTLEFSFNPPGAPPGGGVGITRLTKFLFNEILPAEGLREEVLRAAFADVEHTLNCRPLTYVPLDDADAEALTPNHFLVGNSSGLRERGSLIQAGDRLAKSYRIASQLADRFWKKWLREYLPTLTRRTKWFQPPPLPLAIGDLVIIVDENAKRNTWLRGRIVDVHQGADGQVRSAVVRTVDGLVTRPSVKLAKMDILPGNPPRKQVNYEGGNVASAT